MRADKAAVRRLLKTARGQLDGILRMVEEDQYCIDIVNQLLASDAILRKTIKQVMHAHIEGCVSDAFESEPAERGAKIGEIIGIFDKLNK